MKTKPGSKNWVYSNRVSPEKKKFAKHMRKNPTVTERLLWSRLFSSGIGYRFRRQKVILGWIVDFYCPLVRLVVEVDGSFHETDKAKEKDKLRDSVMAEHGFSVLRLKNEYVMNNTEGALMKIKQTIVGLDT